MTTTATDTEYRTITISLDKAPPVGAYVGCEYRCPYDAAHPDCWLPPLKGTVLALNDPRAWHNTLQFPESLYPEGPNQVAVDRHVCWCFSQGYLGGSVPVEWVAVDGVLFVQWDTAAKVKPYDQVYEEWERRREERRAAYSR